MMVPAKRLSEDDRFRFGIVGRLYRVLLGRKADAGGLMATVQRLRDGLPFATVMNEALQSEEFRGRHADPVEAPDDIDTLFRSVFGDPVPAVDRSQPPGTYAALLLSAAERAAPSRVAELLYPDGVDPVDEAGYRFWLADYDRPAPALGTADLERD